MLKQFASLGKALGRSEMKMISGGKDELGSDNAKMNCLVQVPGGQGQVWPVSTLSEAAQIAGAQGTHYCCSSCANATWVPSWFK